MLRDEPAQDLENSSNLTLDKPRQSGIRYKSDMSDSARLIPWPGWKAPRRQKAFPPGARDGGVEQATYSHESTIFYLAHLQFLLKLFACTTKA